MYVAFNVKAFNVASRCVDHVFFGLARSLPVLHSANKNVVQRKMTAGKENDAATVAKKEAFASAPWLEACDLNWRCWCCYCICIVVWGDGDM